jgi:uncharacterized membrane protein
MLLLKVNIRGAFRLMGRGLGVMLFGSLGVMVGAPIGLVLVKQWLGPDAWKAFGSLSASWVGGSANLAAVSQMFHTQGTEYGLAVFADSTITYFIWLPLLLRSEKWAAPFARFTKVDVRQTASMEQAAETHASKPIPPGITDYLLLLGVALVVTWIANLAAASLEKTAVAWFAGSSDAALVASPFLAASTWRILLITTMGLALSATPLGRIPGSHELAMALLFEFIASVGATAALKGVASQVVPFIAGSLVWIFIHGAFCVLGAKIFRTDIHIAAIASAANIGGAATASIVADHHKPSLVPTAILMALIGYAIGNYTGFVTALICHYVS